MEFGAHAASAGVDRPLLNTILVDRANHPEGIMTIKQNTTASRGRLHSIQAID